MLLRVVFVFAVIFTVQSIELKYLKESVLKHPELQSCVPTSKMVDSSGKLPDGIMSGNFLALGNFDQCLSINKINNKSETVKGKYCLMAVVPPGEEISRLPIKPFGKKLVLPVPEMEERMIVQGVDNSLGLILGWCIPHKCPVEKLSEVLTKVLQIIKPGMKIVPLLGGMCQTKDDLVITYDANSIIFITFLCATLFLMIISTLYDMYIQHQRKKPAHILLIAFSVKTNGQKLLTVSNNPDQLSCLNGIRFLSMMWVVYGHVFAVTLMGPLANLAVLKDWINNPGNMYILNATVSVDTFFVLSGLLVGYVYCLTKDKGGKFNIILYYLHRYLRLTPVLAVVVWFHASIIEFFGSGPFWPFAIQVTKTSCLNNWWVTLLYFQNYYRMDQVCIGQSWYLAVDMHLFILSPLVLIPLLRWPKKTMIACAFLVLGSMAAGFAVTYVEDLSSFSIDIPNSQKFMEYYYEPTHIRFGTWLIGFMLGYYIFKLKKSKINDHNIITLHPSQVVFGWIVGLGLLLSTLFAGHDLLLHPDKLGNSFFNGFHRHGWALGICWVIYACTQGYGGPINSFLSCSIFQILSRFTYTIYLVHLSVGYLMIGSSRTSKYFQDFHMMYEFWGNFMMALVISVCLTLAYESPMVTIEKVLFKRAPKSKEPELPVHQNPTIADGGQINNGFVEE